jgi:hypothetical protein
MNDLHFDFRQLRKNPGFTVVAERCCGTIRVKGSLGYSFRRVAIAWPGNRG